MKLFNWFKSKKALVENTDIASGLLNPFIMSVRSSGFNYDYVQRNYALLYQQFIGLGKSCMEFRAINFAQHKPILYQQTAQTEYEEVDFRHPAVEFLNKLNPEFNNFELRQLKRLNLDVLGNCYWLVERNDNGYPKEVWNLRLTSNTSIEPLIDNGIVVKYKYKKANGDTTIYDANDVIAFREMNPANPYHGIGKIAGNPYAFDMENQLNVYHKAYIENDATGRVYVKVDSKTTNPEHIQELIEKINQDYRGAGHANKLLGLANAEIKTISSNIKEMDFVETNKLYERKIISTYRVHPQLLGMTEDVNKSNGAAALDEWQNVHLKPMVIADDITMTNFIRTNYGDAKDFFVKTIVEPPDDRQMTLNELQFLAKSGSLRKNQLLRAYGYDPIFKLDKNGKPTRQLDPVGFEFVNEKDLQSLITDKPKDNDLKV